ncbi:MAG: hypothetical protein NTX64_11170, partial [Elusimicrobia bacterium]|nr:hypothetical protein [Elusimicrobiota bacterium]
RARAAAVACLAAFLGVWNWTTAVRPGGDPAANKDLQRALWLGRETPEGAWVVVDQVDQVYVPYFAHRKPMNLRYLSDGPRLAARVAQARRAGEPVYAVPETIPAWAGQALEKLGWRQVSVDGGSRLFLIH